VPQGRCYQSAWYAHPFVHVFGGKADKKQLNDLVSFNVLTQHLEEVLLDGQSFGPLPGCSCESYRH